MTERLDHIPFNTSQTKSLKLSAYAMFASAAFNVICMFVQGVSMRVNDADLSYVQLGVSLCLALLSYSAGKALLKVVYEDTDDQGALISAIKQLEFFFKIKGSILVLGMVSLMIVVVLLSIFGVDFLS